MIYSELGKRLKNIKYLGDEGDKAVSGKVGIGASYGGSSKNQGQGLIWMIVDEFPEK